MASNNEPSLPDPRLVLEAKVRELEAQRDEFLEDTRQLRKDVDEKEDAIEELQTKVAKIELRLATSRPSVNEVLAQIKEAYMRYGTREEYYDTMQNCKLRLVAKWFEMGVRANDDGLRGWRAVHVEAVKRVLQEIFDTSSGKRDLEWVRALHAAKESLRWVSELVRGVATCEAHYAFDPYQKIMCDEVLSLVAMDREGVDNFVDPNLRSLAGHALLGPELMTIWRPPGWHTKLRQCLVDSGWM